MWEQDWALLGIEPTTELGVIKKAYALKLRVTRPDDDAEAYQALRGAYERAQQWVKWQTQVLAEAPASESTNLAMPEAVEPTAASAPPTLDATDLADAPTPATLVADVERHRIEGGAAALIEALPQLMRNLNEMPVGMKDAASSAFATWVLQQEDVPLEVLAALDTHFGWRGDYRAERALGVQSFALRAALDERMPLPITDPLVIAEAAPLLGLKRLRRRRFGGSLALLVSTLSLQSLQRLRAAFGDRLLRALGLTAQQQSWLDNSLMLSTWLRWLPASVLLVLGTYAAVGNGEDTIRRIIYCVAAVFGTHALAKGMGRMLWWEHLTREPIRLPGLVAWRTRQRSAWTGVVIVVAGALIGEVAGHHIDRGLAAGIGVLVVAFGVATMRWGASLERSCTLAGCMAAATLVLWSLGTSLLISSWAAAAALWTLLGLGLYEGRHANLQGTPVAWLVRPMSNTLALCDRWGWRFSSWPLLVTSALALLADRSGSLLLLWGVWSISAFLLFMAQSGVDRRCHRWLARQARASA